MTTIADQQIARKARNLSVLRARSADSADTSGSAGDAGDLGGYTASSYLRYGSTLPPGATEDGVWGGDFTATAAGQYFGFTTTFPTPLAAILGLANTVVVSGTSATHCPGVDHAEPGYLCLYVTGYIANAEIVTAYNPEAASGAGGAGAAGFGVTVKSKAAGTVTASGNFAVTAP